MNMITGLLAINRPNKSTVFFLIICGIFLTSVITKVEAEEMVSSTNHNVEISGFSFIPKEIQVNIGDTITWINKDIVPHNIVNSAHQISASPNLAKGKSYTLVVEKPMSYLCGLHPSMTGKVVLTSSP